VIPVDSEFAGLLVAVGFIVMGFVSVPIAKWFLLGALVLGVAAALMLHFIRKAADQAESKRRNNLRLS
jgi:mannose/fructose/N-acetylgalactosamine-specific phosphotransferase system component IIC